MKRTERHQLKQDEFVSSLGRFTDWAMENQKNIVNVTLVVLGAALLLGGLYIYRGRQAERAQALLADALEQFHGVIRSEAGAAPDANTPVFDTAEDRYRAALEAFTGVAEEFSSYEAGRQARYYAGVCEAGLGNFEAAESRLADIGSGRRDLLHYLGLRALASIKVQREDYPGAADIYRSLLDDDQNPLPKDYILYQLARTEERAGNLDQAKQYYDRMVLEFPESQLRGDATSRRDTLAFKLG